jgi:hypothetical protein
MELIYFTYRVISEEEMVESIMAMDGDLHHRYLVYAFGAATIAMSHFGFSNRVEATNRFSVLVERALHVTIPRSILLIRIPNPGLGDQPLKNGVLDTGSVEDIKTTHPWFQRPSCFVVLPM